MTNKDVTLDNKFLPVARLRDVKHRAPTSLRDSAEGGGKLLSNHKYPTQQPKENKATRQLNCTVYKWSLFFFLPPPPKAPLQHIWTDQELSPHRSAPPRAGAGARALAGRAPADTESQNHRIVGVLREHNPALRCGASPKSGTAARSTNCCYLDRVLTSYQLDFDEQGKSLLQNFLAI